MSKPPILVFHHYSALPAPNTLLRSTAGLIYRREHIPSAARTNVILCSDYIIRKLNARYRGIDRATDVLSFPFNDQDLLGEIYISLQRARIQAKRYGVSYQDEVLRLFVHGMFHLLGYEHGTARARRRMERMESRYCCL